MDPNYTEDTSLKLVRKVVFEARDAQNRPIENYNYQSGSGSAADFTSKLYSYFFFGQMKVDTGNWSTELFTLDFFLSPKKGNSGADLRVSFGRGMPTMAMPAVNLLRFGFKYIFLKISVLKPDGNQMSEKDLKLFFHGSCGSYDCPCGQKTMCCRVNYFLTQPEFTEVVKSTNTTPSKLTIDTVIVVRFSAATREPGICLASDINISNLHSSSLEKPLKYILENAIKCDVVLKVEGQDIPAHQNILSGQSDVFAAMFETDMFERNSGIVTINDISVGTIKKMLNFLYCRDVSEIQGDFNAAFDLLIVADKYNISDMKDYCTKVILTLPLSQISISQALDLYSLGLTMNIENLEVKGVKAIKGMAIDLEKSPEFEDFINKNGPKIVSKLIARLATLH